MVWIAAALIVLFIQPAYRRLKAKGYPARIAFKIIIFICTICLGIGIVEPAAVYLAVFFSLSFLLMSVIVRPREGAPGDAIFQITFACPACRESITFDFDREGFAELCPKCGEIVRVPKKTSDVDSASGRQ